VDDAYTVNGLGLLRPGGSDKNGKETKGEREFMDSGQVLHGCTSSPYITYDREKGFTRA
jgi:hypothetical protein